MQFGDDLSTVAVDAEIPATASLYRDADRQSRARFAAGWVAAALAEVLGREQEAVLALVGGSSVGDVHRLLADEDVSGDVDWSRVVVTVADERAVPASSPERNWRVVEPLVDPLVASGRLDPANVVTLADLPERVDAERVDAALAPMRDRVDHVDVALLAAGPDGHCASLFPGHPALGAPGRFTVVTDSPKPPPMRISMTVPMLAASTHCLLIGFGEDKAAAMADVIAGGRLSDAPARIVHLAPHAVVVTDHAAG